MAVPKRKVSKSRRNMRRAHDFISPVQTQECSNCGAFKRSHHVCPSCGHYKGRIIVRVSA